MTRISLGNHPFMLGFEDVERLIERNAKNAGDGFPPYNIEQRGDSAYRITLAVAGFDEDALSISLEDSQLVVRGRQGSDGDDRVFLHRGIATRQFQRSFILAEGVEVSGASLANGLLNIDLMRREAEPKVRKIDIRVADAGR